MEHILPYEAINEGAAALPTMPSFLKSAGAKPTYVQYGGPRKTNQPPNAWELRVPAPSGVSKEEWVITFFPDGSFNTGAGSQKNFLRSSGEWKADASSDFIFGTKAIKGVSMKFNSYMRLTPLN